MLKQRTLKQAVSSIGIGLHSGNKVSITLRPAAVNTGIVFRRTDLASHPLVSLHPEKVGETTLCTALIQENVKIATIEHLLSALAGLGIDNLYIDIDAPEVPIMDGSAAPFLYLLLSAGIEEQAAAKRFVRIKKPIEISRGDSWAKLLPYHGFKIDFTIDFSHPAVRSSSQTLSIDFAERGFADEVARARTFGFMRDIELLRSKNLGLGGSLENAIVLDDFKVLNPDGLRYKDEFVRHKVLDAIGDLYTLGHGIMGHFQAHKAGHMINNLLVRELLSQADAWEMVSLTSEMQQKTIFVEHHKLAGAW